MTNTDVYEDRLKRSNRRNQVIGATLALLVAIPLLGWRIYGLYNSSQRSVQTPNLAVMPTIVLDDRASLTALGDVGTNIELAIAFINQMGHAQPQFWAELLRNCDAAELQLTGLSEDQRASVGRTIASVRMAAHQAGIEPAGSVIAPD